MLASLQAEWNAFGMTDGVFIASGWRIPDCLEIGINDHAASTWEIIELRQHRRETLMTSPHDLSDSVPPIVEGSGGPELASVYAATPARATAGDVVLPVV